MKNVLVYPYDGEFEPFLKYKNMLTDLNIKDIISPIGWGLKGVQLNNNLNVKTKMEEIDFDDIDAFMIVDSFNILSQKELLNIVRDLAHKGIDIIVNRKIDDEIYFEIQKMCKENEVNLLDKRKNKICVKELEKEFLQKIETPIIVVAGMGERCDKFEVQLELRQELLNKGYKVCSLGSRFNSEIIGVHSFSDFMINNEYSETQKILYFNHYMKKLENIEKPDVFIVGIPGGIMPINWKHPEYFGVCAFEILNAINCDVFVLAMHNNLYADTYFKEIQKICDYKFRVDIDAITIGNYAYDSFSLESELPLKYISFNDDNVYSNVETYNEKVYCRKTYKELVDRIENILSDYATLQVI